MTGEIIPMLRTWRKPPTLFSDFNTLQFASVMGLVILIPVLLLIADTRPHSLKIVSVDLPKARHPIYMPGFDREDAMIVAVTRDDRIYFGADQVPDVNVLSRMISDRLKDPSVERKVYIKADMRARWGGVKKALEGVRKAEVVRVAFLVNQSSR